MQGITDSRLKTGKTTVIANPSNYADFETVVTFFTTLLDAEQSMAISTRSHQRNVSAIRAAPGGRGTPSRGGGQSGHNLGRGRGGQRGGRGGKHHGGRHNQSNVTDQSYTKEEWIALSYEDKQKIRDLRAKRNRDMNTSSIKRNVNPRINEVSDSSTIDTRSMAVSVITSISDSTGIGTQMSQRPNRNNNL
jgi:hypothetical protein